MANCFEIWIDVDLANRTHERIGMSLWPIYKEEIDIEIKTFRADNLSPGFISNLSGNALVLSTQEISDEWYSDINHLIPIKSIEDCCKLTEGCCAGKILQLMWRNGINFSKNCKPDYPPEAHSDDGDLSIGTSLESELTLSNDAASLAQHLESMFPAAFDPQYGECIPGILCCCTEADES